MCSMACSSNLFNLLAYNSCVGGVIVTFTYVLII
jgi:hypothetical protein